VTLRPAFGRATYATSTSPIIAILILHKGYLVDKLIRSYLNYVANVLDMTSGGVAPGAAITSQKRSPRPITRTWRRGK
jgi:hypothetical protein